MTSKNSFITLIIVMFCNISLHCMEPDEGTGLPLLFNVPIREIQLVDEGPTRDIMFHPNGKRLVSVSTEEHGIRFWDWKKGEIVQKVECVGSSKGPVYTLAINSAGNRLAYIGASGKVVMYDDNTKKVYLENLEDTRFGNGLITSLSFNPEGTILVGKSQIAAFSWDFENINNNQIEDAKCEYLPLSKVVRGHGGMFLTTNVQALEHFEYEKYLPEGAKISGKVYSSDFHKIAVACGKAFEFNIIQIFNLVGINRDGEAVLKLEKTLTNEFQAYKRPKGIFADSTIRVGSVLGFLRDDKQLVTTLPCNYGNENTFQIWDVETGTCLVNLDGGQNLSLSPDGNALACIIYDGKGQYFKKSRTIRVWDLTEFNDFRKSRNYALTDEERKFLKQAPEDDE